jgi:hypothetical protein
VAEWLPATTTASGPAMTIHTIGKRHQGAEGPDVPEDFERVMVSYLGITKVDFSDTAAPGLPGGPSVLVMSK